MSRCAFDGCNQRIPLLQNTPISSVIYCYKHIGAIEQIVNSLRQCKYTDCTNIPTYGVFGSNKRSYCNHHAPAGYVKITYKYCKRSACKKQAVCFTPNTNLREYCLLHNPY